MREHNNLALYAKTSAVVMLAIRTCSPLSLFFIGQLSRVHALSAELGDAQGPFWNHLFGEQLSSSSLRQL